MTIESRISWDIKVLFILHSHEVLREHKFWLDNVHKVNKKVLACYYLQSVIIYDDASHVACGAYCVEVQNKVFPKMWNESEKDQSSTGRELKAIGQAIVTFLTEFKGKSIKWYTDNQNCLCIVKAGSMKEHLQQIVFHQCMQEGISIDIQWVPCEQNTKADHLSKMIDHEDWGVFDDFFAFIDNLWRPHSVDRFASPLNNKTEKFNSLFGAHFFVRS